MKTDSTIKQDILDELIWEPSIDETEIGITVQNGIVTLSGHVNYYSEKLAAEKAAKRVYGVKAVVEEIDVKIENSDSIPTDQDIAQAALDHLKWDTNVPEDDIKLNVEDGWIILEGEVEWNYQKESAKNAVRSLAGVRGVTNLIKIKNTVEPQNLKEKIRSAFVRSAGIDADHVEVIIEGHKVILNGTVQSWAEKKQAEKTAWSAPGVSEVENNLKIKVGEYAR